MTIVSAEKESLRCFASKPAASRTAGAPSKRSISRASASGQPGSTGRNALPANSPSPPAFVATIGSPAIMASMHAVPSPSSRDGMTKMSMSPRERAVSGTWPARQKRFSMPTSDTRALREPCNGPSPNTAKWTFDWLAATMDEARMKVA